MWCYKTLQALYKMTEQYSEEQQPQVEETTTAAVAVLEPTAEPTVMDVAAIEETSVALDEKKPVEKAKRTKKRASGRIAAKKRKVTAVDAQQDSDEEVAQEKSKPKAKKAKTSSKSASAVSTSEKKSKRSKSEVGVSDAIKVVAKKRKSRTVAKKQQTPTTASSSDEAQASSSSAVAQPRLIKDLLKQIVEFQESHGYKVTDIDVWVQLSTSYDSLKSHEKKKVGRTVRKEWASIFNAQSATTTTADVDAAPVEVAETVAA